MSKYTPKTLNRSKKPMRNQKSRHLSWERNNMWAFPTTKFYLNNRKIAWAKTADCQQASDSFKYYWTNWGKIIGLLFNSHALHKTTHKGRNFRSPIACVFRLRGSHWNCTISHLWGSCTRLCSDRSRCLRSGSPRPPNRILGSWLRDALILRQVHPSQGLSPLLHSCWVWSSSNARIQIFWAGRPVFWEVGRNLFSSCTRGMLNRYC